MKRLLLYALILALVWVVPTKRLDVAKLRPVEVIAIYKTEDTVVLETDTEDIGKGKNAMEALENMRNTSPAIIYLDTAEFLLVEESAAEELEMLRKELKDTLRLCSVTERINLKSVAQYLPVHGALPELGSWKAGESLPQLRAENDRLILTKIAGNVLDNE